MARTPATARKVTGGKRKQKEPIQNKENRAKKFAKSTGGIKRAKRYKPGTGKSTLLYLQLSGSKRNKKISKEYRITD